MPNVKERTWLNVSLSHRWSDRLCNEISWCQQNQYTNVESKSNNCALVSSLKLKMHIGS